MKASKPKPNIVKYTGKKTPYNHGCRMTLRMDRIDSRTKIGRTVDFLYKILWDFIGDENVPALMLIDSIVFKRMQMLFLESQHTDKPIKDFPKVYLSLNNSLRKDLQALAQFAQKPEAPNLDDYLKGVYSAK